ncbi:hypothetical protein Pcinc_035029 [Petrolisthes cinctipes]|uniref:Uncharacterized protein n=1 Tax=Petrolisthes cinctipes TaxID=88211 RepID=A0AAE1C1F7_PETCI|nr:hypothetical protein Pcinc_035029 [Petrolisthes cinctipes]
MCQTKLWGSVHVYRAISRQATVHPSRVRWGNGGQRTHESGTLERPIFQGCGGCPVSVTGGVGQLGVLEECHAKTF